MAGNDHSDIANNWREAFFARRDFVFTSSALALLLGVILPISARMLDVLWVFALCLAAAILLITFFAKEVSELLIFPALLVFTTLMRIAINMAAAKLIFLKSSGGLIITAVGKPIWSVGSVWTVIVSLLGAVVLAWFIHLTAGKITAACSRFIQEIMPIKRIGIETDLNIGTIDNQQAQLLRDKVADETRFHVNLAAVTRLMRCDAAIAVVVVVMIVTAQSAINAFGQGQNPVRGGVDFAAGMMLLALVPAFLIVVCLSHLLYKTNLSLSAADKSEEKATSKKIRIVSRQSGVTEELELLNPDFMAAESSSQSQTETANETIATFESPKQLPDESSKTQQQALPEQTADLTPFYRDLAIYSSDTSTKQPVLFAAESVEQLPVTVVINTAIQIAQKGQRTLVIDADTERNAVFKVFDVSCENLTQTPVETCVKDLFVWSREDMTGGDSSDLEALVKGFAKEYNCVIVYAPSISSLASPEILARIAGCAMIFADDEKHKDRLRTLMQLSGCNSVEITACPHEKS